MPNPDETTPIDPLELVNQATRTATQAGLNSVDQVYNDIFPGGTAPGFVGPPDPEGRIPVRSRRPQQRSSVTAPAPAPTVAPAPIVVRTTDPTGSRRIQNVPQEQTVIPAAAPGPRSSSTPMAAPKPAQTNTAAAPAAPAAPSASGPVTPMVYDEQLGHLPTDERVWKAVNDVEAQYGKYTDEGRAYWNALNEAQLRGEKEMLPGQKNFDPEAPYGRDAQGRPYSLPPGDTKTRWEQQQYDEDKRERSAEIRQAQAERELADQMRRDALRAKRMDELEAKKQRHLKEAEVARAWNDKVRAARGLPPLGATATPGAPAGAPPQPGAPVTPPTPSRAPAAPTAPSPRGPIGAPSVSSVGQTPPMTPVRTLDGDFRRQVIGGNDTAVPLVELTNQGSFVPNPNALNFDEFASAYTTQDASSTADMIRMSNDPQAKREQQVIDQNRRSIASSDKLDSAQKAQALQQLNARQAQLHYGFLQAQGVGAGVRAGFGSISPNAPLMDQVYQRMSELEKAYPNSTAEQRYQLAMQMMSQAGSVGRADGSIPAEVRLMDELGQAERSREQADIAKQQQEASTRTMLDLQAKGMDPEDAAALTKAIAAGDQVGAQQAMTKSTERKMLQAVVQAQAPISQSDIDKQIMSQVLGTDAVYSANAQRYSLMAKARGGDKKAQNDLSLYPDTPEWEKAFGKEGEFDKLNQDLRKTVSDAVSDEKNRAKAAMQIREARGGLKLYDINQPETQMAIVNLYQTTSNDPDSIWGAILKNLPDLDTQTKRAIFYQIILAKRGHNIWRLEDQNDVDSFNRVYPVIRDRLLRWGIPFNNFKAELKKEPGK